MKKINLKGISKILSEKEMKNVMGGMILAGRCLSYNVDDRTSGMSVEWQRFLTYQKNAEISLGCAAS